MCSGSDEHGTPITLTAEEEGAHPQEIVDHFHQINKKALIDMGCSWAMDVDPRGPEYGGALYNRTSDPRHKELVRDLFTLMLEAKMLERKTMQQYCSVSKDGSIRFLPDRYVEGDCPSVPSPVPEAINAMTVERHTKLTNSSIPSPNSMQMLILKFVIQTTFSSDSICSRIH